MKAILTVFFLALISFNAWSIDATHGMVLFGSEKLMAYHLPMFHMVHAKQVVLEYTLPPEQKLELLAQQKKGFLTFVPRPFNLEKFLAKPFSLVGDVYLGHFEKDGVVIMSNITMDNVKVHYKFGIFKGESHKNEYRLFGTPSDLYAVHLLSGGIEKDHIIKVNVDLLNAQQVELANLALIWGNSIQTFNNLLEDGSSSEVGLAFDVMGCNRRWCGATYKKLIINHEKTIFTDDVM